MKYKVIVNCNVIGFGRAVVGQEIELDSTAENNNLTLNGSLELIEDKKTIEANVKPKKITEPSIDLESRPKTTK